MKRHFIYLSYNGAAYYGWQVQPNGISVQGTLTKALCTVLRNENIEITGAGRTDTGVHARIMVAHFDAEIENISLEELVKRLNSFLPNDISVQKIVQVKSTAHARFDAISRTYEYRIITSKNVFLNGLAARFSGNFDLKKMNEAAAILLEYNDFTSFSKLHTDAKNNFCTITKAGWEQRGDELVFTITANRFLRNMVRAIVGTLLDVGCGKISLENFRKIIEEKNRCSAGVSVPAEGLYLVGVEYKDDVMIC